MTITTPNEAEETPTKTREVKIQSNKNFITRQVYLLTTVITGNRILLKKYDTRKIELEEKIHQLEFHKDDLGQEEYKVEKEIKEVRKELDQNDTMIEKTEDIIENNEEMCQRYQVELEDAIEYDLPKFENDMPLIERPE